MAILWKNFSLAGCRNEQAAVPDPDEQQHVLRSPINSLVSLINYTVGVALEKSPSRVRKSSDSPDRLSNATESRYRGSNATKVALESSNATKVALERL